jgi:isopentenyl phosphate kinase
MLRLNAILCQALMDLGLKVSSHPAHIWCTGTGEGFLGAIDRFEVESNIIPITFGDVVDCAPPQDFGILSGDHLVERLAMLAGVRKVIFAISGVDGILSHPPDARGKGKLLEVWDASLQFDGRHDSSIDVTGGILLKAACGSRIANRGPEVWVVNGENPQRIVDVVIKGGAIGTQIVT